MISLFHGPLKDSTEFGKRRRVSELARMGIKYPSYMVNLDGSLRSFEERQAEKRCEKRLVNLVKQDPGRVRQNS